MITYLLKAQAFLSLYQLPQLLTMKMNQVTVYLMLQVNTMVTVVDAANFILNYSSTDFIHEHGESLGEDDDRTLVDLLVEQIEFANVILLNKIDLISDAERHTVKAIIRGLNAKATLIETENSVVPLQQVMNTNLFDFEQNNTHYGLKNSITLKTMSLKLKNMELPALLQAKAPFNPEKLDAFLNQDWQGVIRKRLYLARYQTRLCWRNITSWSLCPHQGIGRWWAAI